MPNRNHTHNTPPEARKFGYVVTILVNLALIYIANKPAQLGASLVENNIRPMPVGDQSFFRGHHFHQLVFLFFDRRWFRIHGRDLQRFFVYFRLYILAGVPVGIKSSHRALGEPGLDPDPGFHLDLHSRQYGACGALLSTG
jgi:hypothetical protein